MAPSRGNKSSNTSKKRPPHNQFTPKPASKPKQTPPPTTSNESSSTNDLSPNAQLPLQQSLLTVFTTSLPHLLDPNADAVTTTLKPLLQKIKQHLYNRDFVQAFGRHDLLEAYAARWSASRALGYLNIFADVFARFVASNTGDITNDESQSHDGSSGSLGSIAESTKNETVKVTCLGGGAGAEICALAALPRYIFPHKNTPAVSMSSWKLEITAIDIAAWGPLLSSLERSLISAPPAHTYKHAKYPREVLSSPTQLAMRFHQADVLAASSLPVVVESVENADVITLMFTLNELYSTSLSKTQTLLLNITAATKVGTLLLIVDSPGSYSTVKLGEREKQYPMSWLADHALLKLAAGMDGGREEENQDQQAGSGGLKPVWEKLQETQSIWFRLPQGLEYPMELENMRYQLHLYRRLS